MSGTNAASVASFASTWGPYAQQAGQALGVNPQIILDQWGLESGFGTNTGAALNNPGSLMVPGTQTPQAFTSPADFVQAFVGTIQTNFPGAAGAGNNPAAYLSGLASGTGGRSYFGSYTTLGNYTVGLAGAGQALYSADPTSYSALSGGASLTGNAGLSGVNLNPSGMTGAGSGAAAVSGQSGCEPGASLWSMIGVADPFESACGPIAGGAGSGLTNVLAPGAGGGSGPCAGIWGYVINGAVLMTGVAMILFSVAGGIFGRGPTQITVDLVRGATRRVST